MLQKLLFPTCSVTKGQGKKKTFQLFQELSCCTLMGSWVFGLNTQLLEALDDGRNTTFIPKPKLILDFCEDLRDSLETPSRLTPDSHESSPTLAWHCSHCHSPRYPANVCLGEEWEAETMSDGPARAGCHQCTSQITAESSPYCWINCAVAWSSSFSTDQSLPHGHMQRGFEASKKQCDGDQACSKNSLCYFHILAVSQTGVMANTIRRNSFSPSLQSHPRDKFASAILADWRFIQRADLPFVPPTLFPNSLVQQKQQQCTCLPSTEHLLAP